MLQPDIFIPDLSFDQHPWYLVALLVTLVFSVVVLLFYYYVFFGRLAFRKQKPLSESKQLPSVSIVIAACNEYLNLKENAKKNNKRFKKFSSEKKVVIISARVHPA